MHDVKAQGGSRGLSLAVVAAVGVVFALAYVDSRREEARALDDFSADQAALARTLAGTMSARLQGVVRDLRAAPASADGPYEEVDLLDGSGRVVRGTKEPARQAILARLFATATPGGAEVESQPLDERLRYFLRRDPAGAVALLVDTELFFADTRSLRRIVIDEEGRWAVSGGDAASRNWQTAPPTAEIATMLAAMKKGEEGTIFLPRPSADALGLGQRSAVAGFAPVTVGGLRWSVGVVASARRVRDRARLAAWRLAATTGLTALLVGLFGVAIRRQERRAQRLADALDLAEATAALRERSEKLVESVPLGVLAVDAAARVTAVNPFLADRGARAGTMLDAPLDALWAEARARHTVQARQSLTLTLDGKAREVDAFAIPLARPLPDVDGFVVLHDRTDLKRLERNLQRAEKLATIGTLSAGIAHEVGTPLGIISGRAEQLLTRVPEGEPGEAMKKGLSSILGQVDKVSTTIRQLLDFARTRPVSVEAVSAATAIGAAASLLEHRFRQAKVSVATDAAPSLPPLAADRGQLEQVLVNLLMNACDACAPGGHVTARARAADEGVLLEIVDDGSGIAPEHLPSVLDPFFTTKKRGQGTGLGLTIAADIVKNHGGTLTIDSTPGQGTTVRVVWPKAVAA